MMLARCEKEPSGLFIRRFGFLCSIRTSTLVRTTNQILRPFFRLTHSNFSLCRSAVCFRQPVCALQLNARSRLHCNVVFCWSIPAAEAFLCFRQRWKPANFACPDEPQLPSTQHCVAAEQWCTTPGSDSGDRGRGHNHDQAMPPLRHSLCTPQQPRGRCSRQSKPSHNQDNRSRLRSRRRAVSYTHLTLPTNREV